MGAVAPCLWLKHLAGEEFHLLENALLAAVCLFPGRCKVCIFALLAVRGIFEPLTIYQGFPPLSDTPKKPLASAAHC